MPQATLQKIFLTDVIFDYEQAVKENNFICLVKRYSADV